MKKTAIVCGLISGGILGVFMVFTTGLCYKNEDFEGNMFLGYASMVLAFSLIFVGIKNYRDKFNNGYITFGKAFQIGLYITLIASSMYVIVWLIDYYLFIPDFMDKYGAHVLREAKRSGSTPAEMEAKATEMAGYQEMYKNPLMVILFTFAEVVPVGLVVSIISALILKKKSNMNTIA